MTKEDEAALASTREHLTTTDQPWVHRNIGKLLLRLLDEATAERDEQAARVAALVEAGNRLADMHGFKCECENCSDLSAWEAAIRARAGSPIVATAERETTEKPVDLMEALRKALAPVAPGEAKP